MTHIRQKLALCCVGFFRLSFRLLSCSCSQPVEPSVVQPPDLAFAHESQLPVSCAETLAPVVQVRRLDEQPWQPGRIKFADLLSRDRVAGNAASDRRQLIEGMNHFASAAC